MKKILYIIIPLLILLIPMNVMASEKATIYVFYGDGCPHCTDLHETLDLLAKDEEYKNKFEVEYLEVWYNTENAELRNKVITYFNLTSKGVPLYVIGDTYDVGFPNNESEDESVKASYNERVEEIKEAIDKEIKDEKDIVGKIKSGELEVDTTTTTTTTTEEAETFKASKESLNFVQKYKVPICIISCILAMFIFVFIVKWITKD